MKNLPFCGLDLPHSRVKAFRTIFKTGPSFPDIWLQVATAMPTTSSVPKTDMVIPVSSLLTPALVAEKNTNYQVFKCHGQQSCQLVRRRDSLVESTHFTRGTKRNCLLSMYSLKSQVILWGPFQPLAIFNECNLIMSLNSLVKNE